MKVQVVDYRSPGAAEQFTRSLHETGFAVLVHHPLPQSLVNKIYADWLAFFQTTAKYDFTFSNEHQDGYFSPEISETAKGHTLKDIKEYFHLYPWGRIPAHLRDDALHYYDQANTLAQELLAWVEQQTPPEVAQHYTEPLSRMIDKSHKTLLRVLRYPPLTGLEPEGSLRAAAHGDINLLTILPAANEPGLQVQDTTGSWVDVPCDFGMLIINTGDMLAEASDGYFPSTQHRVVNPTGEGRHKSRISLPLFLHPRPEVVLSPRHTAATYLAERLRELGVQT